MGEERKHSDDGEKTGDEKKHKKERKEKDEKDEKKEKKVACMRANACMHVHSA